MRNYLKPGLILLSGLTLLTILMPFISVTSAVSGVHVEAYILGYQLLLNSVGVLSRVSGVGLLRVFLIIIYILSIAHLCTQLLMKKHVYIAGLGISSVQFVIAVALFVRLYIIGHSVTDSIMALLISQDMIKMPSVGMFVLALLILIILAGNAYGVITKDAEDDEAASSHEMGYSYEMAYSGESIIRSKKSEAIGKLVGRTGAYAGISVTFEDGEQVAIGRDPELSHIVLDSPTISKVHCFIQMKPEIHGYSIMDRSLNGTYMGDGSRLPKGIYVDVPGGSILYIGSVDNTFALASYD